MKSLISKLIKGISPLIVVISILMVSMFIAIQFSETMQMVERSDRLPPFYWLIIPLVAIVGHILSRLFLKHFTSNFMGHFAATILTWITDRLVNNTSGVTLTWFIIIAMVLGAITFLWTGIILRDRSFDIGVKLENLRMNSYLLQIWTKNTILSRYSQNVLGIAWVMLMPLAHAAVIGFAFSVLLNRRDVAGKPFIIFLLSGIIVYDIFRTSIQRSSSSLIRAMGVIRQIYFPREIVLLVIIGEVLVDFIFSFITLLVVLFINGIHPNWYYLSLVLPTLIMVGLSFGASLYTSVGNLVFRDLQNIISIILQFLFYVTILFSLKIATPKVAIFGLINPLTIIVEFFRTVILYEQQPDFATLVWPIALAVTLVYTGYIFFKRIEGRFIDFL